MSETGGRFRIDLINMFTGTLIVGFTLDAPSRDHARTAATKKLTAGGYNLSPTVTRLDVTPLTAEDSDTSGK